MLALGRCVPWHGIDYNEDFVDYDDDDSGGMKIRLKIKIKISKKFIIFKTIYLLES